MAVRTANVTFFSDHACEARSKKRSTLTATVARQNIPELEGSFGEMLRRYYGQHGRSLVTPQRRALGSGFIADPAGYIVTNNHVIDGVLRTDVMFNPPGRISG